MASNRVVSFLGLSSIVVAAFLAGCEAAPTELVDELVVADKKPVKPPKDVGAEFELYSYIVTVANRLDDEGLPRGFTDFGDVNTEVYKYLNTEFPTSAHYPLGAPTFSDWRDFLGCPDPDNPCSAVTLTMNGGNVLAFSAYGIPVVNECGETGAESCLLDDQLGNHRKASILGGSAFPFIPWETLEPAFETDNTTGHTTFTFYWQGQRGLSIRRDTGLTEKVRGKQVSIYELVYHWDQFPDLHPVGPDRFFFHPYFQVQQRTFYHPTLAGENLFTICGFSTDCLATFTGDTGDSGLDVEMSLEGVANGVVEIKVMAFSESTTNPNPESFARVMMTNMSSGAREMLDYEWETRTSIDRDMDGNAATWFRVEGLEQGVCYRFDLAGLIVDEGEFETFWQDNRLVWDGVVDPVDPLELCIPSPTD